MARAKGALCGGRTRQGGTCERPSGWGTDHPGYGSCKLHSGATPTGIKAAAEQALREQAADALARLDAEPVGNPLEELARLAGQAVAWKDAMSVKVNELAGAIRFDSNLGQEQLRSELALWERSLDRCTNALVAMAKLKIDERLTAIEERKTEIVAAAVREALARSGATPEQQLEAKQHIVVKLRARDDGKEYARAR